MMAQRVLRRKRRGGRAQPWGQRGALVSARGLQDRTRACAVLNGSLVDCIVYMRWELYGWQMGKVTGLVTNATPRLVKKFNYRIVWADGSKGPAKLQVDNYGHGPHARYSSWVILTPATTGTD